MKKTLFKWWFEGAISGFGSFQTHIFNAYKVADTGNMNRLQSAFPEWFVTEIDNPCSRTVIKLSGEMKSIDVDPQSILIGRF